MALVLAEPAVRGMLPSAHLMQGMPVMGVWSARPAEGEYWPMGHSWQSPPSAEYLPAGLQARVEEMR